jgi:hypothetical protein
MFSVSLLKNSTGETHSNPNTAYAEYDANLRTKVDFAKFDVIAMRVVVSASGNEDNDPTVKGIEIYDVTGTQALCDVEWLDAADPLQGGAGSWTTTNLPTADSVITIRTKGSSATEDITYYQVDFQILYC